MVGTALAIEREMEDTRGIRDASAGGSGKRINLLRVWEKDRGLLSHKCPRY